MTKKLAKWLLSKLTPFKEIVTLDKASNEYAEYCCRFNHWHKYASDLLLTREFVEISHSFMNGYILCMHQNDLSFQNGLILKENRNHVPSYMADMMLNDAVVAERERVLKVVENVLKHYSGEYNTHEIMKNISSKV